MITKILRLTLSRLLGVAAMLVACTAMGQITVNDGTARGTCTQFTFAGGILSLSPSNCLGTPPPPPPPIGPVFSFALNNPTTVDESIALGLPNKPILFSVHLERNGNTSPLTTVIEVCAAGTNCTAEAGTKFQLDGAFTQVPPYQTTMTFAPGEMDKTFTIYIVADNILDGMRILTFKMTPASPATVGGSNISSIAITDGIPVASAVSFAQAAYAILENDPVGKAAIIVRRSNTTNPASIQVEISAAGTTGVVGTHYNINDPTTPFTGSPATTTLNFAAGAATAYFILPILNSPLYEPDKVVVFNLKNPVNLTIVQPSSATITIYNVTPPPVTVPLGIDGQPIAKVTIDQLVVGSNNFCAFGRAPGGNPNGGPCGASPVAVSTCGTGINGGGVTNAWELDMVDATGALTYMPFRNHTVHLTMSKGHAMSWKFHTPPANQIGSIVSGGFSQTTTTIGAEATTFMSVSTSRCDFDYAKVNTIGAGSCYRSIGGTGNSVDTRLSPAGTPADLFVCEMTPDTDYYLNVRWENVAGASHTESCPAPTGPYTQCGMVLGF